MGYDMVEKNARCLREGSISFLIAQHAYMQGYSCVDTLFQAIVLKKKVTPVNYMPIEPADEGKRRFLSQNPGSKTIGQNRVSAWKNILTGTL